VTEERRIACKHIHNPLFPGGMLIENARLISFGCARAEFWIGPDYFADIFNFASLWKLISIHSKYFSLRKPSRRGLLLPQVAPQRRYADESRMHPVYPGIFRKTLNLYAFRFCFCAASRKAVLDAYFVTVNRLETTEIINPDLKLKRWKALSEMYFFETRRTDNGGKIAPSVANCY